MDAREPRRREDPPADPSGEEPPPILGSWARLYGLVVLELIGIIALCGWLSRLH
jgi:hypothetical protein